MDFSLSKEHQMAQKLFRDFAIREVEPLAEEIDESHRFPWETLTYVLAVEEIAKF